MFLKGPFSLPILTPGDEKLKSRKMWYHLVEALWGQDPIQHGAKAIAREKRPLLPSFVLLHTVLHSPPSLSTLPASFLSDVIHRRGTVTSPYYHYLHKFKPVFLLTIAAHTSTKEPEA